MNSMQRNFVDPFRGSWHGPAPDLSASDTFIQDAFQELRPCWMETRIDLFACALPAMADTVVAAFVRHVGEKIGMSAWKTWHLARFEREMLTPGRSFSSTSSAFFQLSETSVLSGYCLEPQRTVYLNVFTHHFSAPYRVAALCQQWFSARSVIVSIGFRGLQEEAEGFHPAEEHRRRWE